MKKVLCLAFAVFVLSVMCFSVMPARAEVTFNGEWRIRGYAMDLNGANETTSRSDTASYWDQRFRLYITAKMSDNLKGVVRMLTPNHVPCVYDGGNVWGRDDAVNPKPVLWDVAYLDFDIPLPTATVNAKLGRQGIDLGNMILWGSCKTYDSMVLGTSLQNMSISVLTAKLDEGEISGAFDDEDLYGLIFNIDPAPNINVGVWAIMGNDGDTQNSGYLFADPNNLTGYPDADAFWFGIAANMDLNPVKLKLEFDYSKITLNGQGAGNADIDVAGFAIFGDVSADTPAATIGGSVLYTTGDDKDDNNPDSDLFVPISSHFSERNDYDYLVLRRYVYGAGSTVNGLKFAGDHSIGNIIAIRLYAMKDLTSKLTGRISAQNYSYTQDPDGPSTSGGWMGKGLGTEIDVQLVYKLYDNLTLTGVGAYWVTDEDTFGKDNDNNWLLKHEILYKF